MDKLDKNRVKPRVLLNMQALLETHGLAQKTSIISTSSQNKLGRDEMWRVLREFGN